MSEVCPFCQKTFKRLKAHLPHCKSAPAVAKAAQGSKSHPIAAHLPDDITCTKTSSSSPSLLTSSPSTETPKKSKKSSAKRTEKPSWPPPLSESLSPAWSSTTMVPTARKSKATPASSLSSPLPSSSSSSLTPSSLSLSSPTPSSSSSSPTASSSSSPTPSSSLSSPTPSSSSSTLIPTSKKIKQKLVDEMKSSAVSTSSPSLPTSPSVTKPKKRSLRALIEASQSKPVSEIQKGTPASSLALQPPPALEAALHPLSPRPLSVMDGLSHLVRSVSEPESKATRTTDVDAKPVFDPVLITVNPKLKDVMTKRESQREKAKKTLPRTTTPSVSQDPLHRMLEDRTLQALGGDVARADDGNRFWDELEAESSREVLSWKGAEGLGIDQTSPMLQEYTSSDGYNANGRYSKTSILDHMQTTTTVKSTDHVYAKISTTEPVNVDLSRTTSVPLSLQRQTIALLSPVANPVPPTYNGCQANMPSLNRTGKGNETTKTTLRSALAASTTGFLNKAPPLDCPSSLPSAPPSDVLNSVTVETGGVVGQRRTTERLQLDTREKSRVAEQQAGGAVGGVTQRTLGDVRLRELPGWLADKCPSSPREGVEALHKGWQWYYRRYIDVKRGGVGGVAMLLAGYCVLSYMWSYPHIKRDRWRRYH